MSLLLIACVALAVLAVLAAGVVIGCFVYNYGDKQLDIITRRLVAEQRMEAATRATLKAMRDTVKHYRHGG